MKQETAKALVDAARDLDLEVGLLPTYSGRGMRGRTTAAVSADNVPILVAAVAQAATKLEGDQAEDFVEEMLGLATDNMGLGLVAY